MIAWPWQRSHQPTALAEAIKPYAKPDPLPPLLPGQLRCRHCKYGVELHSAPGVEHWATPFGEDPPKGVTLGNECPARPVPGFRSFYGHEPS